MKKLLCVLLVLISVSAALVPAVFADTTFSVTNEDGNALITPSERVGKTLTAKIGFKTSDLAFKNVISVDVITSTDVSTFPFEISQSNYERSLSPNSNGVYVYDFSMKIRSDAAAGYYTINFKLTYNDGTAKECTVPVVMQVIADDTAPAPDNLPRITITAFSTSPDPVVAGEEITLSVTFTNNTSGVTAKNVKAQLSSDGTFTPVSGSSSMFLGNIGGSSSVRKSIKLKVKADVAPNSYAVTFNLTYDVDGVEEQLTDSEAVSIPVIQVPKLQVSNPQMYPEEIYAGQEMNFMASLNNTGRSILYNVNVVFEDTSGCIEGQEQYIGNIEPGGTKNIDVYLSAVMEGESLLTMTITYEDQDGEIYTFTESYAVYVMVRGDNPMPLPEEPETKGGSYIWIIIVAIVLLAAGGLVAFILINRKKKAEQSKQLEQQQIAQLEWEYSQQNMPGGDYTVGGDMAATTEIPIAEIESGALATEEPENTQAAPTEPEKPKAATEKTKNIFSVTEKNQESKKIKDAARLKKKASSKKLEKTVDSAKDFDEASSSDVGAGETPDNIEKTGLNSETEGGTV